MARAVRYVRWYRSGWRVRVSIDCPGGRGGESWRLAVATRGLGGRMSGQADGGGADGFERRHKTRDDPWMTTVTNVSGFLAGFGLATVVVIAGGPGNFRWPGAALLALTIASVALIVA